MKVTSLLAIGAMSVFSATAASAATLSIDGGTGVNLPGSYSLSGLGGGPSVGDLVMNFVGLGGGLKLDGPAKITFTFIGKEAGFSNTAVELIGGGVLLDSIAGATISFTQMAGGFVDFMFVTNGLGGQSIRNGGVSSHPDLDMAFSSISNYGQSVYALFGDGGGGNDNDLDDMLVKIDVAAVPVPAAGLLLMGALGGLAALRRRKYA
jgi:hypothetical protein